MKNKVLVFGSEGMVGSRFIDQNREEFEFITPLATDVDLLNKDQVAEVINFSSPDAIVNFAAFTNVDKAEEEKGKADGLVCRLNADSTGYIADICQNKNIYFLYISTDYIFGGEKDTTFYTEEDIPSPLNWYGETKLLGEKFVKSSGCKNSIIRIEMPFRSAFPIKQDIVRFFIQQLKEEKEITAISDQYVTPLFIDDLSNALKIIIQKRAEGIYHIVNSDSTTPFELVKLISEVFGFKNDKLKEISFEKYNKTRLAKRAKYSWMDNSKFKNEFGKNILHTNRESLEMLKSQIDKLS